MPLPHRRYRLLGDGPIVVLPQAAADLGEQPIRTPHRNAAIRLVAARQHVGRVRLELIQAERAHILVEREHRLKVRGHRVVPNVVGEHRIVDDDVRHLRVLVGLAGDHLTGEPETAHELIAIPLGGVRARIRGQEGGIEDAEKAGL